MSRFSPEARKAARPKGNAEDFAKVTAGDRMQFRVTDIGEVYEATDAPNGAFDCLPFGVEVRWIERNGRREDSPACRWEPAADKCDGLIDIADKLEELTGDQDEILRHDLILSITESEKRTAKGRKFYVYNFEFVGPWPGAGQTRTAPATSSTPAAPRTSTPAPSSSTPPARPATAPAAAGPAGDDPEAFLAALRSRFGQLGTMAQLEQEARRSWPEAQRLRATVGASDAYKSAKLACAKRAIGAAGNAAELDQAWAAMAPAFQADEVAFAALSEAYRTREAEFAAFIDQAFPGDDEAPPPF